MAQPAIRDRRNGATLEEVAALAGVSRATASRVVNGSPRVSDGVRRDVQAAITALAYVPNRAARSLVTRRSGSIAVVITEPAGRLFTDPFFPRVLRGASAFLAGRDLQLVLLMPASPADANRTAEYLTGGHADGALLVSLHGDDPLPDRIASAGIPTVLVGRPSRGAAVSYVDVDNRGGARSAVDHLLAGKRRVIATIAGPSDMPSALDRLAGYRDALADAGVARDSQLEVHGDFTPEGGAGAMRRLLAARPDIDAVFAA
ncbi:MAG: LacI family DNA-binding transcriptional regulator, partial [Chloroflexota bacterium]